MEINLELWFAFVAASSLLLLVPGPTILTVIAYSISHGREARWPLLMAVALGDSTAIIASLFGLGVVLANSLILFQVIKIIGGIYVLYLGIGLIRDGLASRHKRPSQTLLKDDRMFWNTYLVTALNPKGIVFFVAFLPLFVDSNFAAMPQLVVLGMTFVALAVINCFLYLLLVQRARHQLMRPSTQSTIKLGGGGLMSLAGVWALLRS